MDGELLLLHRAPPHHQNNNNTTDFGLGTGWSGPLTEDDLYEKPAAAAVVVAAAPPSKQKLESAEPPKKDSFPLVPNPERTPTFIEKRDAVRKRYEQAIERLQREREERIGRLAEVTKNRVASHELPPQTTFVDFTPAVRRLSDHAAELCKKYLPMLYIPRVSRSFADPVYDQRSYSGNDVHSNLKSVLETFPDPPTQFQWKLADATFAATAPLIYGEEYNIDPEYINDRHGWRFTDGVVGVLTGRKTGKSTGLAMICIAYMFVISGFRGAVASRTLEQAKIIVKTVQQLVKRHPWFKEHGFRVGQMRATYVSIIGPDETERSIEAKCGDGNVSRLLLLSFFSFREPEGGVLWLLDLSIG